MNRSRCSVDSALMNLPQCDVALYYRDSVSSTVPSASVLCVCVCYSRATSILPFNFTIPIRYFNFSMWAANGTSGASG
jgi:hypothetical protein